MWSTSEEEATAVDVVFGAFEASKTGLRVGVHVLSILSAIITSDRRYG